MGVFVPECDIWSVRWLAPELLFPEEFGLEGARCTKETDIYTFTMVMYEVGPLSVLQILPFPTWNHHLRNPHFTTGVLRIFSLRGFTGRGFDDPYQIR